MSQHDKVLKSKAGATLLGCTDRIVRVFKQATPLQVEQGTTWYHDGEVIAHDLARKAKIEVERAAIVIAHLSPQTSWARNIAGAYGLVLKGKALHCMSGNVERATVALEAEDPWDTFGERALKTKRFARNLLGDTECVTVDVWALRIALGVGWGKKWRTGDDDGLDDIIKRVGVYEAIEHAYQRAAKRLQLQPTTVQATTWIVARNGRAA